MQKVDTRHENMLDSDGMHESSISDQIDEVKKK